jgi:PST family polysaccharide transporter/lipopolysaccharide exporter
MKAMKEAFSGLVAHLYGNTLKARCARSSVALGIGVFSAKLFGLGSKVVLTRLLVPQEMGLMVMILSLTAFFEVLTEIGIKQSVIQHKNGASPEYLNMAWWFQSLRAIGLYAVAFIAAPWLCEFYFRSRPEVLTRYSMVELITLVRAAFLTILFNGFISPKAHVLEKNFSFGRAVVITQGSFILGSIVTIILAFVIRNVWAIVIGFATIGFARCLISYALCPFMPRFAYDRESFQGLYRFAKGMFGLPLLSYIAFNIDVLVAGKLVSTSLVGFYGMALALALSPWDIFAGVMGPVLLPAFAEKQDDRESLCRAVLQITKYTALLLIPPTALVVICGGAILTIIYGAEYSVVAVPFGLLCVCVLLLVQEGIFANVFFGIGQPDKHRLFVGLRALILILCIYPSIKFFGLTGAAAVVVLANFAALFLQVAVAHRTIGLNVLDYTISWLFGLAFAIPVLTVVVFVRWLTPGCPMVHLTIGSLSCIVVCLAGLVLLKRFDRSGRCLPGSIASVGFVASREDAQRA